MQSRPPMLDALQKASCKPTALKSLSQEQLAAKDAKKLLHTAKNRGVVLLFEGMEVAILHGMQAGNTSELLASG